MSRTLEAWNGLDARRKLVVAVAAIAALAAMIGIFRLSQSEDMALLYAGLEPATAGEVITALEGRATPYEVRGNAIYVPRPVRDETRLALASDGLPASGGVGYELLDTMTGFGTTAQMFDAAYWRAKEGELARTILSSRDIRAARVHIATPARQPFARPTPVTASVTITPAGTGLTAKGAEAIRFLVASAVAGLDPDDVAVIDTLNGVVPVRGSSADAAGGSNPDERAERLKANLERLLAARVGENKAIVEVSIDADMDTQRITERVVDPTSRVAISTDVEERTEDSSGAAGGGVTVASNLPDGDADAGGGTSTSATSETRERQNYEISETRRERVIQPGQIRRISVAVMVDGITTLTEDGTRSWAPRPEEEMTALRELVESAIGFDAARGDRVTLQSLEFPTPESRGTEALAETGFLPEGSLIPLIQTAVLGLVAVVLGLFVIRPLLTRPPALPAPAVTEGSFEVLTDGEDRQQGNGAISQEAIESADQSKIKNLRSVIEERSDDSAEVLRRWIESNDAAEGAV